MVTIFGREGERREKMKHLDDVVREYSTNSFPGILRGLRKYSLTALAVGALGVGSLGGCNQESEPVPKPRYGKNQTEQEARIEGQTKIAFVSDREGNREIYVMNADGSDQRRLTNNPAIDEFPLWSPDGTKIAFASKGNGNWEPYIMNADGKDQRKLIGFTEASKMWEIIDVDSVRNEDYKLKPFEFAILRQVNVQKTVRIFSDRGSSEVWTNRTILPTVRGEVSFALSPTLEILTTFGRDADTYECTFYMFPTFSPDERQIALSKFSNEGAINTDIYVMNADGSDQRRLTNHSAKEEHPFWSPDGKRIAFVSWRDGNPEIYTMNSDGSEQKNLTNSPSVDISPSWSPDGNKIAFSSMTYENWKNFEIYVMNADGSDLRRLTTNPGYDGGPSWFPSIKKR